jgi:hypothetical protein
MGENNSVANLGDLAKPATVLIEKISNAVGVLYEPTRIRRQARAEMDAEKIKALARIELTSLEDRAMERFLHQEARKQENIESITAEATSQLPADAKAEQLSEDWIAHFFKQCDTVADKDMQSLWARILAGEATKPGSFSKRTVNFVADIEKSDAALFTALGQFVWSMGEPTPLVADLSAEAVTKAGLSFSALKHLDAIGLISFESVAGYQAQGLSKYATLAYFGTPVFLEFPQNAGNNLNLGKVLLTSTGKQLFPICGAARNDNYFNQVLEGWRAQKITATVMVEGKPEVPRPSASAQP